MENNDFKKIVKLVGNIEPQQLKFVDGYVHDTMAVFMPVAGPCYYALMPDHTHPSYMFLLNFNNQSAFVLGNKTIHSDPKKISALAPMIKHQEINDGEVPRYLAFFVDTDFFEKQASQYTGYKSGWQFIQFPVPDELNSLAKRFMIEADSQLPGYHQVLDSITMQITHLFIRGMMQIKSNQPLLSSRLEINNAIEFMAANLDKSLTLKSISDKACMSVPHFSRVFKDETGTSPNDFLIKLRLEKAKKMLLAGANNISEIADECGFKTAAYFSSTFCKHYRKTPTEFQLNSK